MTRNALMNLPNKLTISRFLLAGLFLWAMFARWSFNDTLALLLFFAASFTDFLDGRIARKRRAITTFGILMDPVADKILICTAFIALAGRARFHPGSPVVVEAWMAVIVVARELVITGLRLLAASKNVVLAAEGYGKHKTTAQVIAVIALLVMEAQSEWASWIQALFSPWIATFALLALWVALTLTVVSGFLYMWHNRQLYLHDM